MAKTKLFVVDGTTAPLDAKLQKGHRDVNNLNKKQEHTENRLRALWSYGNQLTTMLLQDVGKAAEGAAWAAGMQQAVAILQKMQTEVAIVQTVLQAKAAFVLYNYVTAGGLTLIAGYMQYNLGRIIHLEVQAKETERRAKNIQRQIETYRS